MNAKGTLRTKERSFRWSDDLYRLILDGAPDAILVVNERGGILLSNEATETMFGYSRQEISRMCVEDLMPERERDAHLGFRKQYNRYPRTRPMGTHLDLRGRRRNGTEFPVDIMLSPVRYNDLMLIVAVIRDNTVKERERRAREELLATLQSAHSEIRTLSGLLPICAWCKNIRDDKGYWFRLEEYFESRSEIDFTHGICPDCAQKFSRSKRPRPSSSGTGPKE